MCSGVSSLTTASEPAQAALLPPGERSDGGHHLGVWRSRRFSKDTDTVGVVRRTDVIKMCYKSQYQTQLGPFSL